MRYVPGEALHLSRPWVGEAYKQFTHNVMKAVQAGKRPPISDKAVNTLGVLVYVDLMRSCWSQEPQDRPHFSSVLDTLRDIRLVRSKMDFGKNMSCPPPLAHSATDEVLTSGPKPPSGGVVDMFVGNENDSSGENDSFLGGVVDMLVGNENDSSGEIRIQMTSTATWRDNSLNSPLNSQTSVASSLASQGGSQSK